ncbi:MAG: hypothetical protein ACLGI6_10395, partial [Gammaproteobacteria bacterium]
SETGRGTTFRIYLPQSERPAKAAEEAAPASEQRGRELVLVVEDEPVLAGTVTTYLERAGYDVSTAGDGLSAVELARQSRDLSTQIVGLVGAGNFGEASNASTTLSRACRTCHTFYKKE